MGQEQLRFSPLRAEWRVEDGDDGTAKIVGHAAVFDRWSEEMWWGFREKIANGAFTRTLREEVDCRALWNHDANYVLGRTKSGTLRLKEDDVGLAIEIDAPTTPTINDLVLEPIRRGDVDEMSFGFMVIEESWKKGEDKNPDERTLIDVELYDVSPVTYPAYVDTDVAVRSAQHEAWKAEMEAFDAERKRLQAIELNKLGALEDIYCNAAE